MKGRKGKVLRWKELPVRWAIMLADLSSKQAYQAALLQQDAANKAATEQFFTNSPVSSDGRTFRPGTH